MGVPADELVGDRLDDAAEVEGAFLLGHPGVKDDLQEKVAEFLAEFLAVARRNGLGDLEGFLDRIGSYGREILFEIPRAARLRRPQRGHDLDEAGDVARLIHPTGFAEENPTPQDAGLAKEKPALQGAGSKIGGREALPG